MTGELSEIAAFGVGRLVIPDSGMKGAHVGFTPAMRAAVDPRLRLWRGPAR